jgi:hypothetical protein
VTLAISQFSAEIKNVWRPSPQPIYAIMACNEANIIFASTFHIFIVKEKGVLIQNESKLLDKNFDISRAGNAGPTSHHFARFRTDGTTVTSVNICN